MSDLVIKRGCRRHDFRRLSFHHTFVELAKFLGVVRRKKSVIIFSVNVSGVLVNYSCGCAINADISSQAILYKKGVIHNFGHRLQATVFLLQFGNSLHVVRDFDGETRQFVRIPINTPFQSPPFLEPHDRVIRTNHTEKIAVMRPVRQNGLNRRIKCLEVIRVDGVSQLT